MRNLRNFLGEFHATFKKISSLYQVLRELPLIVKQISLNFRENFTFIQFFKKFYST